MSTEKTIVNIAIVGGLAVGAYVLFNMMRQGGGGAAAAAPQPSRAQQNAQGLASVIGAAGNLFKSLTGGGSSIPLLGTVDGRSAAQWDVTPFGNGGPAFNNPSAYVSSSVDGAAFNPPSSAPYDAMVNGAWT